MFPQVHSGSSAQEILETIQYVSEQCVAVICCLLVFPQNYSRPPVMALAIPIAVRFLHRGSKELRRSLSNYLCLAAIAKAELLAEHTEAIVRSILQGTVRRSLGCLEVCSSALMMCGEWDLEARPLGLPPCL